MKVMNLLNIVALIISIIASVSYAKMVYNSIKKEIKHKEKIKIEDPIPMLEEIYFEKDKYDTHGAYNKKNDSYTIVADGVYITKVKLKAGHVVHNPLYVRRVHK